jgi:hypothetical protein
MNATKRVKWGVPRGLAVAMLATLAFALPSGAQPAAFDPQTLIGEWSGEFRGNTGGGKYYLTIEKVDGDKVHLRIERPDLSDPALPKDVRFVGTLSGNVLSYAPQRVPATQLTVDGNKMSGTSQGRETLRIELRKTK